MKGFRIFGTPGGIRTHGLPLRRRPLYADHGLWVRPASMWNEEIERDGKTVRRFERIAD